MHFDFAQYKQSLPVRSAQGKQKGFAPILLLVGILVIIGIAGGTYYFSRSQVQKPKLPNPVVASPTPQVTSDETASYNELDYCIGHSGTISQITINNGKITEPDRSGYLSAPAYDYHCYKFNLVNSVKSEVSIYEMNNLNIKSDNVSAAGWRISQENLTNKTIGGLILSNIYLVNGNKKIFVEEETAPTKVFKFIGWSN